MPEFHNIVVLTGAGISAESGLATFRGPDGLWEGHRVEDVATPEAFRRDPALVQAFYDARRARRAPHRPPECRRPSRAGRGQAASPHAWRAEVRLVHRLRRPDALGRRNV